ncbi:hypothetical protein FRUB_07481 [Fimbriiglobus ruber]|uniref:Uncharacterized protein n=1 Tax=Fimbriiglobus ruber TaxID=1908690 RepID=A0A225D9X6_9BACT|nr:hypothetical protein FRUB_07481 [Fimbriiglobus ruber]
MHVEVFGIWRYTRSAPRAEDFEIEVAALHLAAPVAALMICAAGGGWAGMTAGRWARRVGQGMSNQPPK